MGLDMMLYKKRHGYDDESYEEIAYWRKANQIREWINVNVCNGELKNVTFTPVTYEQLTSLLLACQTVYTNKDLPSGTRIADDILPTASGFFFGSTDYDDWYYDNVKETIDQLTIILRNWDEGADYAYYEWW